MTTDSIKNNTEAKTLTVVVLDDKSQPTENAKVIIQPINESNVTNNLGEVSFKLGNENKYEITASYGSKTVTVPYYVTKDGATRLVVNPTYVRKIEKQLHQNSFISSTPVIAISLALGLIVLFFIARKIFRPRKRRRAKSQEE